MRRAIRHTSISILFLTINALPETSDSYSTAMDQGNFQEEVLPVIVSRGQRTIILY